MYSCNNPPAGGAPANGYPTNGFPVNGFPTNNGYPAFTNPAPAYSAPASPAAEEDDLLDWDAEIIEDEKKTVILPEGDYLGQVVDVERGRFDGSDKMKPCDKFTITMEFKTPEGDVRIRKPYFLRASQAWRIGNLLCGLGLKKSGEKAKLNTRLLPGRWGLAHLRPRPFEGGDGQVHQCNEIAFFRDYDSARMPQALPAGAVSPVQQTMPAPQTFTAPVAPPASPVQQTMPAPQTFTAPVAPPASPVQQTMQGLQGPAVPPGFTNVTGDIEPPW